MIRRTLLLFGLCVLILGLVTGVVLALSEAEPNDTPEQANALLPGQLMDGAIEPVSDQDFYALDGVNIGWGYIALLDTRESTDSQNAELTAFASDGTTVLQTDNGSWEHGSGIALQNYADGDATHYLRVNEVENNNTVTTYTLRHYQTIITSQPEQEPNELRETGTPSSYTHEGQLSSLGDRDCFAFHGRAGDTILLALNADPEGDGSTVDPILELISPTDTVIRAANETGLGGKEFLEYGPLLTEGLYAYCLTVSAIIGTDLATYRVGIVRNGNIYQPAIEQSVTWLNPGPGGFASPGDTLTFQLQVKNASPVHIPDEVNVYASYLSSCLGFVNADPAPSATEPGRLEWVGLKDGLAPGEEFNITLNMVALSLCTDTLIQDTVIEYFFSGRRDDAAYAIRQLIFLPDVQR